MRKLFSKLAVLFVLAALLVTGIVFAVSAEETRDNAVGASTSNLSYSIFAGTRTGSSKGNWESAYIAGWLTAVPSGTQFWPTFDADGNKTVDGDSIWLDFEYYYDANVKSNIGVRMRSASQNPNSILMIENGAATFNTALVDRALSAPLRSDGWHHFALKYTQTTVADEETQTVTDSITVGLYMDGEYIGSVNALMNTWQGYDWLLYDSTYDATKPDKVAYAKNASADANTMRFRFYGDGFFYDSQNPKTDARLIRLRNTCVSYGTEPRVDYAPIKLLGDGVVKLAPTDTIDAVQPGSAYTVNENYPTYDVVEWKNFYEVSDSEQIITLPEGSSDGAVFAGWFGDENYQTRIETLTVAAGDADGVTVYPRAASALVDTFYVLPGAMYSSAAVPQYGWQGSNFKPIYDTSGTNKPIWIEFDYYLDADTDDIFTLRFYAANKNSVLTIQSGEIFLSSSFFDSEKAALSGYGWHHIALKYEQSASLAEGESTPTSTYHVTVYVDGGEAISADVTKGISTWVETNGWNLYTVSVAEDGSLTYAANTSLQYYFYGSHKDIYGSASGLRYERHLNLVRDVYATFGTNALLEMYGIKYNLGGGSLAADESISGWEGGKDGDGRLATYYFLPFRADGTAVTVSSVSEITAHFANRYDAMSYDIVSAMNYYVSGTSYTLPTPVLSGMSFAGWYDNPNFTGEPITEIPASQVGEIELYAKFEGNWRVTLNTDGGESTVDGKHNFFTAPDTAELWFVGGALYEAGESVTLTADTTFYAVSVELLDGASIRMHVNSGIRFETLVRTSLLAAITDGGAAYTIGTLITPTDLLSGEFTAEALSAAGVAYADLTSNDAGVNLLASGSDTAFLASVININAQNYARAFSAISYLEIAAGGETYRIYSDYSAENNSRSVYEVAKAAYADAEHGYTAAQLSIVKSFIDGVLVLDGETLARVDEVTANGYTSPYTVSYESGVITITKPAAQALATVIIGERVFVGGWSVSEDGTTVTASYAAVAP